MTTIQLVLKTKMKSEKVSSLQLKILDLVNKMQGRRKISSLVWASLGNTTTTGASKSI